MNEIEIVVVPTLHEGVSSKTGKEYSFYTFTATIEGLEVEFVVKDKFAGKFLYQNLKERGVK